MFSKLHPSRRVRRMENRARRRAVKAEVRRAKAAYDDRKKAVNDGTAEDLYLRRTPTVICGPYPTREALDQATLRSA